MAQSLSAVAHDGNPVYNAWLDVAAAQTDAVLVAAVALRRIRVIGFIVSATDAGAVTYTFNSKPGGAGTAISPTFESPLNGGIVGGPGPGWFETNVGEGLSITTGAASSVAVLVVYQLSK